MSFFRRLVYSQKRAHCVSLTGRPPLLFSFFPFFRAYKKETAFRFLFFLFCASAQHKKAGTTTGLHRTLDFCDTMSKQQKQRDGALGPKRPRSKRAYSHIKWIFSWAGLEDKRAEVRALAREIYESDAAVRASMHSVVATGSICAAIRDPSTAPTPEIARAAKAHRDLRDLHGRLVWEHHLDWDFVRMEWSTVLDPSPLEAERARQTALRLGVPL